MARETLIVADASPVIGLAKIGRLTILDHLAVEVLIPRAVWNEIVGRGGDRPEVTIIAQRFERFVREPDERLAAEFQPPHG